MKSSVVKFNKVSTPLTVSCGFTIKEPEEGQPYVGTTQLYDRAKNIHIPDYTQTPLILLPWVKLYSPDTDKKYENIEILAIGIKVIPQGLSSTYLEAVTSSSGEFFWRLQKNHPSSKSHLMYKGSVRYTNPVTGIAETCYLDIPLRCTTRDPEQLSLKALSPANFDINPIVEESIGGDYIREIGVQMLTGTEEAYTNARPEIWDWNRNQWVNLMNKSYSWIGYPNGYYYSGKIRVNMKGRTRERFRFTAYLTNSLTGLSKVFEIGVKMPSTQSAKVRNIGGSTFKVGTPVSQVYKAECDIMVGGSLINNITNLYSVTWHAIVNSVDNIFGHGKTISATYTELGVIGDADGNIPMDTTVAIYVDVRDIAGNVVIFETQAVKDLCLDNFDDNEDGIITYEDLANVTSLGTVFKSSEIVNFHELRYFTGLTGIGERAFDSSSVQEITLPEGIKDIGRYAFIYCLYLEKIVIPAAVTRIRSYAFTVGKSDAEVGNLKKVIFKSDTPCTLNDSPFGRFHPEFRIYVPQWAFHTYLANETWNNLYGDKLSVDTEVNPSMSFEIRLYEFSNAQGEYETLTMDADYLVKNPLTFDFGTSGRSSMIVKVRVNNVNLPPSDFDVVLNVVDENVLEDQSKAYLVGTEVTKPYIDEDGSIVGELKFESSGFGADVDGEAFAGSVFFDYMQLNFDNGGDMGLRWQSSDDFIAKGYKYFD